MKINVTVDLEDFWFEEDSSNIADEIRADITHKVKQHIWELFKKDALHEFSDVLQKELTQARTGRIQQIITDLVSNEKLKKSNYSNDLITFEDYAKEQVKQASLDNSTFMQMISKGVTAATQTISEELKNRYDILFASQLVAKMNESGLLKDDVARLLLDNGNNG